MVQLRRDHAAQRGDASLRLNAAEQNGVGSLACFVIAAPYREHGVATTLARGRPRAARARGLRAVEAYPRAGARAPHRRTTAARFGCIEKAGFEPYRETERYLSSARPLLEAPRRGHGRPPVRHELLPRRGRGHARRGGHRLQPRARARDRARQEARRERQGDPAHTHRPRPHRRTACCFCRRSGRSRSRSTTRSARWSRKRSRFAASSSGARRRSKRRDRARGVRDVSRRLARVRGAAHAWTQPRRRVAEDRRPCLHRRRAVRRLDRALRLRQLRPAGAARRDSHAAAVTARRNDRAQRSWARDDDRSRAPDEPLPY